ncbi:ankyrin repeat domain-containing protein [bacterium]|nr:ankyrin repeat domain-containing protein [bacterium]MDA7680030.1 ankyrin repeat domain-containing protein [bacterium]
MKHLLLTTIAAVGFVGCGPSVPDISIHEAAEAGNIEAVKQHLAAGTDVNAKHDGRTPLHGAALHSRTEITELLIANDADVNSRDVFAVTPLHLAATLGHKEIVELLIANGADVNTNDWDESTPLHFATDGSHMEIAELLIAEGADVNTKVEGGVFSGRTPLDLAWLTRQTETIDLLRNHRAKTGKELEAEGK